MLYPTHSCVDTTAKKQCRRAICSPPI